MICMTYNFKTNGIDLTQNQLTILGNFLLSLNSKPDVKIIYRGESIENLKLKLNICEHDNLLDKLNYFIFKIGEKGRVYQEKYYQMLKSKNIFAIDDTSERFLKHIFNKINHVIKTSKNPEIINFKKYNSSFVDYFSDKNNSQDFIRSFETLPKSNFLKVRDYYLEFLHRVGFLGFYLNTFFVSTTPSKKIAQEFTKNGDIIFVSWRSMERSIIKKTIADHNLPVIKKNIFSYQKEFSVKGALFPQDIIGFIDRSQNIFHVNPNLFNYPELIDYMIKYGIPTDQSEFGSIVNETNYSGSVIRDGNVINDNHKNNF